MIKSMTAFSQAGFSHDGIEARVTLKSYNSRHLDVAYYGPDSCQGLEDQIKKSLAQTHRRGRIEVRLSLQDQTEDPGLFKVDSPRAAAYYKALEQIRSELNLAEPVSLSHLLGGRNMVVAQAKEQDMSKLWAAVGPALEEASESLDRMRCQEGENLYRDLSARIDYIEENLVEVISDAQKIPETYKRRLMERIQRITADTDAIDPVRIAQEAAILADKSDVSEEIVRIESHIALFRQVMQADVSQGRKLNFLIQEFNREFNTIGSKAGSASLSHRVVDLKSELEKIREQVQNVE